MIGQHLGRSGIHTGFVEVGDEFMRIKGQTAHSFLPVVFIAETIA